MLYYVYEHWRPDTGTCFYVGKGHGRRAWKMSDRNNRHRLIQDGLRKVGLMPDVRIVLANLSEQAALDIEATRIARWRRRGAFLANQSARGNSSGSKWSPERREKFLATISRRPPARPPVGGFSGRRHSEETKEKLRKSSTGRRYKLKSRRASPSPETRERMRKAALGRKHLPQTIEKIRQANLARRALVRSDVDERTIAA